MEKSKGILNVSSLKLIEKTKALKEKLVGVYLSLESYWPWINVYGITLCIIHKKLKSKCISGPSFHLTFYLNTYWTLHQLEFQQEIDSWHTLA